MSRLITSSLLTAALALTALGGCASNRTFVLQPAAVQAATFKSVSIKPADSAIEISPEDKADFEKTLAEKLTKVFGSAPTAQGDLVLQYRFVLNDKGNTAHRVGSNVLNLVGSPFYGFGDGAIGVEVVYSKRDGTKLAHIVTDGTLSGAFGNTGSAIGEATSSIAKYAEQNFAPPQVEVAAADGDSTKPSLRE